MTAAADTHTVELYRQTEGPQGESRLIGLTPLGFDGGTIGVWFYVRNDGRAAYEHTPLIRMSAPKYRR